MDGDGFELRVGTDLQSIAQVAASIERFGDRYLRRLFTTHELDCCQGGTGPDAASGLAARFAAKEATIKVLRPPDRIPPWTDIEVRRQPGGWCDLLLAGEAERLGVAAGLATVAVSLSHGAGVAMATVVAACRRQA
jgi:holo-[acyl-carrier protein] synthase